MFLLSFLIGNVIAEFPPEFGISQGNRAVDRDRMSNTIGKEMRHCPESKGILIFILGITQHSLDEVTAARVVKKIGEEMASERVITQILDYGAAVGVTLSLA